MKRICFGCAAVIILIVAHVIALVILLYFPVRTSYTLDKSEVLVSKNARSWSDCYFTVSGENNEEYELQVSRPSFNNYERGDMVNVRYYMSDSDTLLIRMLVEEAFITDVPLKPIIIGVCLYLLVVCTLIFNIFFGSQD